MSKQEYLKKQMELSEVKWQAYDNGDYAKADAAQAELESLVDPEPDQILAGDESLLIFEEDTGSYEDVERRHDWMRKTY